MDANKLDAHITGAYEATTEAELIAEADAYYQSTEVAERAAFLAARVSGRSVVAARRIAEHAVRPWLPDEAGTDGPTVGYLPSTGTAALHRADLAGTLAAIESAGASTEEYRAAYRSIVCYAETRVNAVRYVVSVGSTTIATAANEAGARALVGALQCLANVLWSAKRLPITDILNAGTVGSGARTTPMGLLALVSTMDELAAESIAESSL